MAVQEHGEQDLRCPEVMIGRPDMQDGAFQLLP